LTRTMQETQSMLKSSEIKLTDEQLAEQEDVLRRIERYNAKWGNLNRRKDGSINEDEYNCVICRNKGYIHELDYCEEFGYFAPIAIRCECLKERKISKALKDIEIGENFTFDTFETDEEWQQTMVDKAKKYIQNGAGRFLYIGGAIGSGKTHICFAVIQELIKRGYWVKIMYWSTDVMRLKSFDDESYPSLIDSFIKPDVLLIEDLFRRSSSKEGITAADINIAYDIINSRYMQSKRTIISSQHLISELHLIDSAVGSRVYKKAGDDFTIVIGRDEGRNYRLRKKEKSFE
jgi:DNA replication protein DnaC